MGATNVARVRRDVRRSAVAAGTREGRGLEVHAPRETSRRERTWSPGTPKLLQTRTSSSAVSLASGRRLLADASSTRVSVAQSEFRRPERVDRRAGPMVNFARLNEEGGAEASDLQPMEFTDEFITGSMSEQGSPTSASPLRSGQEKMARREAATVMQRWYRKQVIKYGTFGPMIFTRKDGKIADYGCARAGA